MFGWTKLLSYRILSERQVCEEHYNMKYEIGNHIEEKVDEMLGEKINKAAFTKDQKTVNNENKVGLSQIEKILYGNIECEDCDEAFKNLEL